MAILSLDAFLEKLGVRPLTKASQPSKLGSPRVRSTLPAAGSGVALFVQGKPVPPLVVGTEPYRISVRLVAARLEAAIWGKTKRGRAHRRHVRKLERALLRRLQGEV